MAGRMRRRAERAGLALMAGLGIAVVVADLLGWLDTLSPGNAIPKITLLVLSTVTLFLLLEVERFQTLDNIDARLAELDIETIARQLKVNHYAGLVKVHPRFADDVFIRHVTSARQMTILNTWIPNLDILKNSLTAALSRRAEVRILLLYPYSGVARMRDEALRAGGVSNLDENVKEGVERCFGILESVHNQIDPRRQPNLKVRVYNSLPSVSVYRADGHYLVSVFLHGQLAIHSPQLEIDGSDTILAKQVQRELDTLWDIGRPVDLGNWPRDLDVIRP